MSKKPKLIRVIICFDIPFLLFLKDSIKSNDNNDEELAEPYIINLSDISVKLTTIKRINKKNRMKMYMMVDGDRYGQSSYSSINIEIDSSQLTEGLDYLDIATRAINHFIDHYRVITKTSWMNRLTISHIQHFLIVNIYDDGTMKESNQSRATGEYHGFGGSITKEQDDSIRSAVLKEEPPNIFELFDIRIRNHADAGEWELAIIESAIAHEAWMYKFIRNKFTKKGLSENEIESKFTYPNSNRPRSITWISKNLVKEATGFDFEASTEYGDWESKVRDIRNEIVHGKKIDATNEDAKDAFQTVIYCIELLNDK